MQAFDEMETNTPGTVRGVSQTVDGGPVANSAEPVDDQASGREGEGANLLGRIKRAIFG